MAYIDWSDSLSVKINMMDNQHKKLIQLINNLGAAMSSGKGKDKMDEILSDLKDYTKYHFSAEEKHMKEHNYHDSVRHIRAHGEFIDKIMELQNESKTGGLAITVKTMSFLSKWLQNHIMETDKALGNFLLSKGVS